MTRPRSTSTSTSSSAQPGGHPARPGPPSGPRRGRGRRPRQRRRPGSARNRRAAAAARSGRRAATPAPRRRARPRPGRARYPPGPNFVLAATLTGGMPGSSRGTGTSTDTEPESSTRAPWRIEAGRADLAAPAASLPTTAARAPARAATPADQRACPASASWAATRTTSSRNGRVPMSSIEAEPVSPRWRMGFGVPTHRPSQAAPQAWRDEANNTVTDRRRPVPGSRSSPGAGRRRRS